jgi:hypothetical protein
MKILGYARIAAVAVLAMLMLSGTGLAFVVPSSAGPFSFIPCPNNPDYNNLFFDVRRAGDIASGLDVGGTSHCAVNFTGSVGSAGDTWLTRYNGPVSVFNAFQGLCMRADVLINRFDNAKGGGLVALLPGPGVPPVLPPAGEKGLLLLLINNGNTDLLTLNTIDPDDGTIEQLASVTLRSGIVENAWYRLDLKVTAQNPGEVLQVEAKVRSHTVPSDPNSIVDGQIGSTLVYNPNQQLFDLGLQQFGLVGMAAWAKLAKVNTSITNFAALAPAFAPLGFCEEPA